MVCLPTLLSRQEEAELKRFIKRIPMKARDAGESLKEDGPLLPQLQPMAMSTKDTAVWEAYEVLCCSPLCVG